MSIYLKSSSYQIHPAPCRSIMTISHHLSPTPTHSHTHTFHPHTHPVHPHPHTHTLRLLSTCCWCSLLRSSSSSRVLSNTSIRVENWASLAWAAASQVSNAAVVVCKEAFAVCTSECAVCNRRCSANQSSMCGFERRLAPRQMI